MSTTFKSFLTEMTVKQQAAIIAKDLLGALQVKMVDDVDDNLIQRAREIEHKSIQTAAGPWIISLFKIANKMFARVDPPNKEDKQIYFVPADQEA
jgi:hypothetical protein